MKRKLARVRIFQVFVFFISLANSWIKHHSFPVVWAVPPEILVFKYPVGKKMRQALKSGDSGGQDAGSQGISPTAT
jgi:hypothetical protein